MEFISRFPKKKQKDPSFFGAKKMSNVHLLSESYSPFSDSIFSVAANSSPLCRGQKRYIFGFLASSQVCLRQICSWPRPPAKGVDPNRRKRVYYVEKRGPPLQVYVF